MRSIPARLSLVSIGAAALLCGGRADADAKTFCTNFQIELLGENPAGVRAKWTNAPPQNATVKIDTRDATLGETFRVSSNATSPGASFTFATVFNKTEAGVGRKWIVGHDYEVRLTLDGVPASDGMTTCPQVVRGPLRFTYEDPYRHLSPVPDAFRFLAADTPVGQTALVSFDLLNDGANPMAIQVGVTGEGFTLESSQSFSLDPAEQKEVKFRFSPARLNFHGASVRFSDALSPYFLDLTLEGRGTAPIGDLSADVAEVDFGKIRGAPPARQVKVTNNTGGALTVSLKPPAAPFKATPSGNIAIEAGASVTIDVTIEKKVKRNPAEGRLDFGVKGRKGLALSVPLKAVIPNSLVVTNVTGGGITVRKSPDDWRPVDPGEELDEDYEISTDPDSSADLVLADGSIAKLEKGSQIQVSAFYKKGGVVQTEILLTLGELSSKVQKSDVVRSDFKVRAPTATASVRGTDFDTIHDAATGRTTFRVREGVVLVDPGGKGLKSVTLTAGFEVVVGADSISKPAAVTK